MLTILLSRGNVIMLGEAYAFGVIWSFAMKALSVLVLRYKRPGEQAWKVPLNFRIGETEIPMGLMFITMTLFSLALINLLTKQTATIAGSFFTLVFFVIFSISERRNRGKGRSRPEEHEKFRLEESSDLSLQNLHVRPGNILVEVHHPDRLEHLKRVLEEVDPGKQDVVVVVVHRLGPMASAEYELQPEQIASDREIDLLSKVVSVAEKAGKHVELLVIPARNSRLALAQTAEKLQSARIVESQSPHLQGVTLSPEEQARQR